MMDVANLLQVTIHKYETGPEGAALCVPEAAHVAASRQADYVQWLTTPEASEYIKQTLKTARENDAAR